MTERRGLLLVLVNPAPVYEDELNDWYDTEHLPERRVLPGFLSALRFVAVDAGPRYAALYDLDSLAALDSPEYSAISGVNFSPWTRRVTRLSKTTRIVAQQIDPGDANIGSCARVLLLRFGEGAAQLLSQIEEGARQNFGGNPQECRYRIFTSDEPSPANVLVVAEFMAAEPHPLHVEAFGAAATKIELSTTYKPY